MAALVQYTSTILSTVV